MYTKSERRAFSIPELLVVMGVLGILVALLIPSFSKARSSARGVSTLSQCRQIGIALANYASQWKGSTPTIYQPLPLQYPPDSQRVEVDGVSTRGNWFNHATQYRLSLRSYCDDSTFYAPGHRVDYTQRLPVPDFFLTLTLYAHPSYWNRWTQRGADQWGAQRLDSLASPSVKGLVYQMWSYGLPGMPSSQQTMYFEKAPAAVLWADSSATTEQLTKLHPGEPNFYDHSFPDRSYLASGPTIAQTLQGVLGRDRGGTYAPPRRSIPGTP